MWQRFGFKKNGILTQNRFKKVKLKLDLNIVETFETFNFIKLDWETDVCTLLNILLE